MSYLPIWTVLTWIKEYPNRIASYLASAKSFLPTPHFVHSVFRYKISFEIHNCNAILFQQGTVYHALQQDLFSNQRGIVTAAAVKNGELKFPKTGNASAKLFANVRREKVLQFSGIHRLPLLLCQKTLFHQPGKLAVNPMVPVPQ